MLAGSTILIIDDEPKLRFTLSVILRREGYSLIAAATAKDALCCLKIYPIQLAFLDLKLPDMDGLKLLPEIQRICPDLPVVVLTADDSIDRTMQALRLGAAGYLLKPIRPEQILTCVTEVLKRNALPTRRVKPRGKKKVR